MRFSEENMKSLRSGVELSSPLSSCFRNNRIKQRKRGKLTIFLSREGGAKMENEVEATRKEEM